MIVKVCGITTAMDALTALDAGADAIGFNFWAGSSRYVKDTAFLKELPDDFWRVGLFVHEDPQRVLDLMAEHRLDVAQLHKMDAIAGIRVWKAISVDGVLSQERIDQEQAEAVVLDTPAGALEGGTGRSFDWELAAGLKGKIVLAGGLDAENVGLAIQRLRPWGVDACSRLESEPGKKDRAKMRAFIEAARKEFDAVC
ncbi:phosphoribosylanthranilate isomerase [Bryobacter aggregatus]|uniref:phosphoribosylanthranilate isomerase n=1 Tax=Bryobacter aggregatus TaxID=360054 RepID=UPI0004E0D868|nr:phosphoribosylanthranilate isomerase [Bryobacter aggregatus]